MTGRDLEFDKMVKQVLKLVKIDRQRLPKYSDEETPHNNWRDLDCAIKLMECYLEGKSLDWFDVDRHMNDWDACACYDWLMGGDSTYGKDYLG